MSLVLFPSLSLLPSKLLPTSLLPPLSLSSPLSLLHKPHRPSTLIARSAEKSGPETGPETKLPDSDPPVNDDEWGEDGGVEERETETEELEGLKRCLVDTVYGSDLGFRASVEVRAEVAELVSQLEAANPTLAPTEATGVLAGKWVLV